MHKFGPLDEPVIRAYTRQLLSGGLSPGQATIRPSMGRCSSGMWSTVELWLAIGMLLTAPNGRRQKQHHYGGVAASGTQRPTVATVHTS